MAVNQNIIKTCIDCGSTTNPFRPKRNNCRPCERLKYLEWHKKQVTPIEAVILEAEFFERLKRKQHLADNPHLKWCENGQHFVTRSQFSKSTKEGDGLQPKCKACVARKRLENLDVIKAKKKIYCEQNKDKIRAGYLDWYHNRCDKQRHYAQSREWRKTNSLRYKELGRAYYKANRDTIRRRSAERFHSPLKPLLLEKQHAYYRRNRERVRQRQKEYNQRNRETLLRNKKEYWQRYYADPANREKRQQRGVEYHKQNPGIRRAATARRRALKLKAPGCYSPEQAQAKIAFYGNCCYLCGADLQTRKLHLDHRIPLSRGGTNWIANIAPACSTCNLKKSSKTEFEYRLHLSIFG